MCGDLLRNRRRRHLAIAGEILSYFKSGGVARRNALPRFSAASAPPTTRMKALAGDRKGQHSIRVNDQFRVCFRWTTEGPTDIEIVDYH